jgi:two-component system chemotaxis response regulator CheB
MANRDILTIGTSAGGVEALLFLAGQLPRGLEAAIFVTIHLSSQFRSDLDELIARAGPLRARFAVDNEPVETGRIYLARPGRHLLIESDRVVLGVGPRENNFRPSIDPMMRSAGLCCGSRAIGVVLTGALGDGAAGLRALKHCGGITVVQDPADAAFAEMPQAALRRSNADRVVPLAEMPALLRELIRQPAGPQRLAPEYIKYEVEIAKSGHSSVNGMDRIASRPLHLSGPTRQHVGDRRNRAHALPLPPRSCLYGGGDGDGP